MVIDVDLTQFHAMFFEESIEGLDTMEAGLLGLDVGKPDPESINSIFRAAHSIKGGAGTFGFNEIAEYTHVLETLLDEMREGKRGVTKELVDMLLQSVDGLRDLVVQTKAGETIDKSVIVSLQNFFGSLTDEPIKQETTKEEIPSISADSGWRISFHPHENLLSTGNEPYRLLRELHKLGELRVTADLTQLPDFTDLDPEACYLGWNMLLSGEAKREQILEVFDWVQGDCDLELTLEGDRRQQPDRREEVDQRLKFGRRDSDGKAQEATSIRVDIDKVDGLVNLVGELVITQSMLNRFEDGFDQSQAEKLKSGLVQLARNTRDLQEQTLQIRMLPIDFAFQRLPRLVHDLSRALGKKVELKTSGEKTELDKTVLEKIGDPLVHLVRNALDHGIEMPDERRAAGKPETGQIELSAYHEGGNIIIEVKDDGAGLNVDRILKKARSLGIVGEKENLSDEQIHALICHPGFTTAVEVSDVSGRGVGMDVVKRNITDLGGHVNISSELGKGSRFTIRLPLTLAILDGQLVRVRDEIYIIPLLSIIESVQMSDSDINAIAGQAELYNFRDDYIPILRLFELNAGCRDNRENNDGVLVIVDAGVGRQHVGLYIDEILGQQQVVIKSLEKNFKHVQGLSGATILGDGTVALILDLHGLIQHHLHGGGEFSKSISDQIVADTSS